METNQCSMDACARIAVSRGYCNRHYLRLRKYGDPAAGRDRFLDPAEGLAARTVQQDGCVVWTGALTNAGYARIRVAGSKVYAHRYAWEQANGSIPAGADIDHICHNRSCVSVEHLRIASREQNGANRAGSWNVLGVRNVYRLPSGNYRVVVGTPPDRTTCTFPTLEEAATAAERIRAEKFGQFAGKP